MGRIVVILLYTLACCAACTTTAGPVVSGEEGQVAGKVEQPSQAPPMAGLSPTAASQTAAVRILGIRANDQGEQVVIRLMGSAPIRNYTFQRVGDYEFALELEGARNDVAQSSMVNLSRGLRQINIEEIRPNHVRLSGALTTFLKDYSVAAPESNLELTLYCVPQPVAALGTITPPAGSSGPSGGSFQVRPVAAASTRSVSPSRASVKAVQKADNFEAIPGFNKSYNGKAISLDLQDADVRNVLRLLADVSGLNIVIEPGVNGTVTLKVDKVPWDQVLDMVLMMNGLGKEQGGSVIRICTQEKLNRELKAREDLIRAHQQLSETSKNIGEVMTVYLTINHARPSDMAAKINEIKSDRGKISVDEPTNLIIYSDFPYYIDAARQLLTRLDKPKPQVLIEARIVQLSKRATRELGIDWSFNFSRLSDTGSHLWTQDFAVNVPVAGNSIAGFSFGQITGQSLWNIDMQLSAVEQTGKGKIISSPRVLTMDGIEAVISQGVDIPYLELSDAGTASTEFRKAVLELKVKPNITPDGKVRVGIQAKNERPDFSRVVSGQPPIDTQEINTELLVDDGNTVVIGGIIIDDETTSTDGTPGLNKVPVLGWLFKSEAVRKESNELLIFITPRIIETMLPERT